MNQEKIGKFIAERRKIMGLTQNQLAEKLFVTDRAVSKWETGKAMPDSAIMLDLCQILKITINDLFYGEVVSMENYKEELEKRTLEIIKQKEENDKKMLSLEIIIGVFATIILLGFCMVASFAPMEDWLRVVLIVVGFALGVTGIFFAVRIEQVAGYYECKCCKHRYVPTFKSVVWAMHFGRTRFMKCPKCGKWSWQKKVVSKESENK